MVDTRGPWTMEATSTLAFFTDNKEFYNGNTLEQAPLYLLQSHLIYTFRSGVWASASAGYDYGGRSTVNGVKKNDRRQDLAWALSCGFPFSRHLGGKIAYLGTRTQEDTGIDSDTFTLGLSAFCFLVNELFVNIDGGI